MYAELTGRVSVILKSPSYSPTNLNMEEKETRMIVKTRDEKKYVCHCSFPIFLHEGDILFAICTMQVDKNATYEKISTVHKLVPNTILKVERHPMVIIGSDKETILRIFSSTIPISYVRACNLYEYLEGLIIEKENNEELEKGRGVVGFLDDTSLNWNRTESEFHFEIYSDYFKLEKAKRFFEWWFRNRTMRQLYCFGLSNKEINMCLEDGYSINEIYNHCLYAPYKLLTLSMEKCADIYLQQNKQLNATEKFLAIMSRRVRELIRKSRKLSISTSKFKKELSNSLTEEQKDEYIELMKQTYGILEDDHHLFLSKDYVIDVTITQRFHKLLFPDEIEEIEEIENKEKKEKENIEWMDERLNDEQKNAISAILENPIVIIKGGPGTGKSSVCAELTYQLEKRGESYEIGSFTGKAVSRLREILNKRKASTLHRLIAKKKDSFSVLIVDETSMVTANLFYNVLVAFPDIKRFVFIGDENQLPPINGIAIFHQLIDCKKIPTFTLTTNHRTTNGIKNGILVNSENLLRNSENLLRKYEKVEVGKVENFVWMPFDNFHVYQKDDINIVGILLRSLYNRGVSSRDVTILTPYEKYLQPLNKLAQYIFLENESDSVVDSIGVVWKIGDRVMMVENNYDINIFNGEEGIVTDITSDSIDVTFKDNEPHKFLLNRKEVKASKEVKESKEENEVKLKFKKKGKEEKKELTVAHLTHSYALTIHKSQGSEWTYIIIYLPLDRSNASFFTIQMLYTAITRAKFMVWLFGASNVSGNIRSEEYSDRSLQKRLQDYL